MRVRGHWYNDKDVCDYAHVRGIIGKALAYAYGINVTDDRVLIPLANDMIEDRLADAIGEYLYHTDGEADLEGWYYKEDAYAVD